MEDEVQGLVMEDLESSGQRLSVNSTSERGDITCYVLEPTRASDELEQLCHPFLTAKDVVCRLCFCPEHLAHEPAVMPPCRTVEEEVMHGFLVLPAGRAGGGGRLVDSKQVFGEWDMSSPELNQYASLCPT